MLSQNGARLQKIHLGGGKKRIDKLHEQGKMSARERIDFYLIKTRRDLKWVLLPDMKCIPSYGGCPVVVWWWWLRVSGRQCIVVANDATVKLAPGFQLQAKESESPEIAMETACLSSIWLTALVFTFPCRTRRFLTKNTLAVFFRKQRHYEQPGGILRWL